MIITCLVKEGVAPEEIAEIMQMRCKEKKKIGATTGLGNKSSPLFILSLIFSREKIR